MIEAGHGLREALATAGSKILVHSLGDGATRTGSELLERAERLAGALADRDLHTATIGLRYRNSAAALEAFIAVELLGATRLPVEPSATAEEAARIFAAGTASVVLTDEATGADDGIPHLIHTDDVPLSGHRWSTRVQVEADRPLVVYPRAVLGNELFGIPTSYANWQHIMALNIFHYREGGYGQPLRADECYLTVVQLMHATGMVGSFPFLHLGLPQVLIPRFNAATVITAIREYGVTTVFAVPGMLTRIADELGAYPDDQLSSLRRVLYGGAPVDGAELTRLVRLFGPCLVQLYGRYEAGWPLAVLTPEDHSRLLHGDDEVRGSCGKPAPGVQFNLQPLGTPGGGSREVRVRSGMVSPRFADADGWCSLGDVAVMNSTGYIHLAGRVDGMINTGSFHVYPAEVREAILTVPGVTDALVTGEPSPRWGHAVTAYVVSADPAIATAVLRRLRQRLAPYKLPRAVHVVDTLPALRSET